MTTLEQATDVAVPRAAERRGPRGPGLAGDWWRHIVAVAALAFALFPVLYVISAAFNADQSLSGASLIPRDFTLDNFREIFSGGEADAATRGSASETNYLRWLMNSVVIALTTAALTVLLGALAAYAFSRLRFRGRRIGMLTLLLIQMFPQFLALVAIYLIMLQTGDVIPQIGLNTKTGLILVYMGGAMGVNAWLLKGFFDTIPTELDESARVDGATPAQIFWGIVLPLAAPILAVIGLLSFVGTINEYVIASVLLQDRDQFTLPLGMNQYIDEQYAERWGPFAAGVVVAAVPAILLFAILQPVIVRGLTQGSVKG